MRAFMHPVGAQLHTSLPAGAEAQTCPFHQGDANLRRCVWPGPLSLSLSAAGAVFEQTFVVDREGPATLPGEPRQWPQGVTVDGRAAAVISLADRPVLVLPPRTHRIAGRIRWASLPDVLRVPGETGVLSVTLDGRSLPFPQRDTEGRLWLQQARGAAEAADHLEVQVHRRMDGDIPFLRETRLDLTSRGAHPRERWACRPLASTVTAAPQRPLVRVFVDVGEPHQKIFFGHVRSDGGRGVDPDRHPPKERTMKRIAPLTAAALLALTGTALAVPVNVLNQVTPLVCGGATPNEQVQVRLSNNCDASVPTAVIYRRVMGPDIVHSLMAPRGVVYDQHTVPAGQNIVRAIVRVDSSVAQCFAATLVGDLCI